MTESVLTLSIGFCSIDTKDICYVDRAEIAGARDHSVDQTRDVELRCVPEGPS